jgi:hypothetical protein
MILTLSDISDFLSTFWSLKLNTEIDNGTLFHAHCQRHFWGQVFFGGGCFVFWFVCLFGVF